VDDQPVFVAAEVEDDPVVADEVGRSAELPLDVVRISPAAFACHGEPSPNMALGLRVTFPELLQRPFGDNRDQQRQPQKKRGRLNRPPEGDVRMSR
jgi:hypothetical protein